MAGVWLGTKPPKKGDWVRIDTDQPNIEERGVRPVEGPVVTKPDGPARYVLCETVTRSHSHGCVAKIMGSNRDMGRVARAAEERNHREENKQRQLEEKREARRQQQQERARERGPSMGL